MKHRSKQRRNEQRKKGELFLSLGIVLSCGIYFFLLSLQTWATLNSCDSGGLRSYEGHFTVNRVALLRNTNYYITLNNGDVIEVPSEYLSNDAKEELRSNSIMEFRYSHFKRPFKNSYLIVSISSKDKGISYIDEQSMRTIMYREMRFIGVLSLLCFGLVAILGLVFYTPNHPRRKK